MAEISNYLVKQFAELTAPANENKSDRAYGTVTKGNNVILDGSELETPCETIVSVSEGDRVIVDIKDHTATIVGNVTDPAYNSTSSEKSLANVHSKISVVQDQITEKVWMDDIVNNGDGTATILEKISELEMRCDSINLSVREVATTVIVNEYDEEGNPIFITDEEGNILYTKVKDENGNEVEMPIQQTTVLSMEEVRSDIQMLKDSITLSVQLEKDSGYLRLGRGEKHPNGVYFTVDSENFSLDESGNVTIDGTITARKGYIGTKSEGWTLSQDRLRRYYKNTFDTATGDDDDVDAEVKADDRWYDFYLHCPDATHSTRAICIRSTEKEPNNSTASTSEWNWDGKTNVHWLSTFFVNSKGGFSVRKILEKSDEHKNSLIVSTLSFINDGVFRIKPQLYDQDIGEFSNTTSTKLAFRVQSGGTYTDLRYQGLYHNGSEYLRLTDNKVIPIKDFYLSQADDAGAVNPRVIDFTVDHSDLSDDVSGLNGYYSEGLHMAYIDCKFKLKTTTSIAMPSSGNYVQIGSINTKKAIPSHSAAVAVYINGRMCSGCVRSGGGIYIRANDTIDYSEDYRTTINVSGCWII